MLNRPTFTSAAVGTRQPVGVDPTLTLVANDLLCTESFARMAPLNCERSGPHPAKPSRDALAERIGDDVLIYKPQEIAGLKRVSRYLLGSTGWKRPGYAETDF